MLMYDVQSLRLLSLSIKLELESLDMLIQIHGNKEYLVLRRATLSNMQDKLLSLIERVERTSTT